MDPKVSLEMIRAAGRKLYGRGPLSPAQFAAARYEAIEDEKTRLANMTQPAICFFGYHMQEA